MANLLITGGAGYIGSHACVVLLEAGHDLIVFDSFINSSTYVLDHVAKIANLSTSNRNNRLRIIKGDIRDDQALRSIFSDSINQGKPIEAVIHFAGLKSINESIDKPLHYWDVNVKGSHNLLSIMELHHCRTIVFSSSASIYGSPKSLPIKETDPINPLTPYGNTKVAIEQMLFDLNRSNKNWRIICLRYFNPVGAHPTGEIGESPLCKPSNIFPSITQAAIKRLKVLKVFGDNWPTYDGTCVRDYIHIMDLAEGHLAALEFLLGKQESFLTINLGSGKGYSVLELIREFQEVTGEKITYEIVDRRPGDIANAIADPSKANSIIGWKTRRSIKDICRDGWEWQKAYPNGYSENGR